MADLEVTTTSEKTKETLLKIQYIESSTCLIAIIAIVVSSVALFSVLSFLLYRFFDNPPPKNKVHTSISNISF